MFWRRLVNLPACAIADKINKERKSKMSEHAIYSTSASDRWMNCSASIHETAKLSPTHGDGHSMPSAKGTTVHAIGEHFLTTNLIDPDGSLWGDWSDVGSFNIQLVTDEMIQMARDYHAAIQEIREDRDELLVEHRAFYSDELLELLTRCLSMTS